MRQGTGHRVGLLPAAECIACCRLCGPGRRVCLSIFSLLWVSLLLSLVGVAVWPLRRLIRRFVRRGKRARPRVKRVVIVGLDGQDPDLTEQFMEEGLLPNFSKLRQRGCFRRLGTTLPAESPVAWSSFQTGCHPGKHRIFDFLVPDRRVMGPQLCSRIGSPGRVLRLGKYRIPLGKSRSSSGRRSKLFWQFWESTASSAPSSGCRSRFHPNLSTVSFWRACVFPI